MTRWLVFVYGLFAYAIGFASLIVFMLFIGDWPFAPWRINGGDVAARPDLAIAGNGLLMLLFGVQHSLMARPSFKRVWTKVISPAAERSTYVLASGVVLVALCVWWQRLPGTLWQLESPTIVAAIYGTQIGGWLLVVIASFTINHWELFGLEQTYCHLRGKSAPPASFTERGVYRWVRHPIQTGVLIGIWFTPTMTTTHMMFSAAMTAYVLIALPLEERDLIKSLGAAYEDYRRRVPMLFPLRWPNSPSR